MQHAHGTFFGEIQRQIALALYEAGSTDREIADAIPTSVNNIIWWRRDEDLPENLSPEAQARAKEQAYVPPVQREPVRSATVVRNDRTPAAPKSMTVDARQVTADHRLVAPEAAQTAHAAPVQPEGDNALEIGTALGQPAQVDLAELLTTRLLIQGNSGSGKSHLLRRLLEECAGIVQQVIVDPEGDFVSFGDAFGHTVVQAREVPSNRLEKIAAKARQLRGSVVLSLEGMEPDAQMNAAASFLNGLFDAGPEHWHPAIVAVDEAHLFAPATDNGEDKETRKFSQVAMSNLMCRGRKRGLAGIIATQRLSKLHKNVAAEASNFLLGRTFLDIDIARATDLIGLPRSAGEEIRALNRGEFLGLGPAISRRPMKIKIGTVQTAGRAGEAKGLTALPTLKPEDMQRMMLDVGDDDEDGRRPALRVVA